MPCIYYGDEIGTEGFGDPFNRGYFNWDKVSGNSLREFFIHLARIRKSHEAIRLGDVYVDCDGMGRVKIERKTDSHICRAYVNMGAPIKVTFSGNPLLLERGYVENGEITLDSCGFMLEQIRI
jgi:glycosidase